MSAFVAPLLWVRGKVRNVKERVEPAVEAVEPRAAEYDDHGNVVRPAQQGREARPERTLWDVLIDTDRDGTDVPTGMVEVVMTDRSFEATSGYLPTRGDVVEWPIRGYLKWVGPQNRRRSVNAYSFAGDVYAADQAAAGGKRSAGPTPVANAS